jgi:hypothetical protein
VMVLSGSSSRDSKQMAHSVDVSMKVDFADMVDRASVATRAGVFVWRLWLLWEGCGTCGTQASISSSRDEGGAESQQFKETCSGGSTAIQRPRSRTCVGDGHEALSLIWSCRGTSSGPTHSSKMTHIFSADFQPHSQSRSVTSKTQ